METLLYYFLLPLFFGGVAILVLLGAYEWSRKEKKYEKEPYDYYGFQDSLSEKNYHTLSLLASKAIDRTNDERMKKIWRKHHVYLRRMKQYKIRMKKEFI
tara:strand:- start:1625 stop:1924 length:300 start_codon:yes stop_codon:yes gene_type:complete